MMKTDMYGMNHVAKSSLEAYRIPGWRVRSPLQSGAQAHTFIVSRPETPAAFHVAKIFRDRGPEGYVISLEEQRWRFLREVTTLQLLNQARCPGVVSVIEFGLRTETTANPWYIMPLYRAGAMRTYDADADRFIYREDYAGNLDRVLEIAEALAETLSVMHEHPSVCAHRDLNMSNILFAEEGGEPVLADFGIAHLDGFLDRPSTEGPIFSGAWHWRPPELNASEAYPYTAGDIYMLGGLVYEALSGGEVCPPEPLEPGSVAEKLAVHTTDERVRPLAELLCRMLVADPERRPVAREVWGACRKLRAQAPVRKHEQVSDALRHLKQERPGTVGSPNDAPAARIQQGIGTSAAA